MPTLAQIRFDKYYRYDDLTEAVRALAQAHPDLVELTSLGTSFEGRDIHLLTVTNRDTGKAEEKPAIWVDGNIHATEVSACSACLYLANRLATSKHPLLDSRTFYIVPRVNPDGAEAALADRPKYLRSSVRPHPYDEDPVEGLVREDVDGDGRMLSMRIPDPNGPWKVCPEDPRLLIRRQPEDLEGEFYRVLPEGRMLPGWDGVTLKVNPYKEGLDLNRNFPASWRPEDEQSGSGPFPTSEPEVRAIVAFLTGHPNICSAITFHTYSGVLLRPFSAQADENFPAEDLWTYKFVGDKGTELTGYPHLSVYHDFRYHPKQVITGVFDDWMYDHLGVFAWTVELWSPHRRAGITRGFDKETKAGSFNFIDWWREHPLEDDLKLLAWSDSQLQGKGYHPWRPFHHPDFGDVELGGWDLLFGIRNPPTFLLEEEIAPLSDWVIWQGYTTPKLDLLKEQVSNLGDRCWKVSLVVANSGWLPTYVSKRGKTRKMCREVLAEIELPEGARLVAGKLRCELGHLEGKAYKDTACLGYIADPSDDRAKAEWVVQAPPGTKIHVTIRQERSGVIRRSYDLT
ncbi:MAG: M14 family metallopeptidase [Candidatus Eremiobacterota bacterium]